MKTGIPIVLAVFAAAVLTSCARQEVPDTDRVEQALKGGCHWDCPKCPPNEPDCGVGPCVLVCPQGVKKCGDRVCPKGEVCCNESCGICTEPFGFCTKQLCMEVEPQCHNDADCRTFSDYCDRCSCLPLGTSDPDPMCFGVPVSCFADPCTNEEAVCNPHTKRCELLQNTIPPTE